MAFQDLRRSECIARIWVCLLVLGILGASCSSGGSESSQADVEGELPIPGSEVDESRASDNPTIVGDLDVSNRTLPQSPDFDELAEKYPEELERLVKYDFANEDEVEAAYQDLLSIYRSEGRDGLHEFLLGSGVLAAVGLDTVYTDFVLAYEDGGWEAARSFADERGLISEDQLRLVLELESDDTSQITPALEELGVEVLAQSGNQIEAGMDLEKLERLGSGSQIFGFLAQVSQLPDVVKVKFPAISSTDQVRMGGETQGEGPKVTGAASWHEAGVTGQGIKIGIIDPDGFGGYRKLAGVDLPSVDQIKLMPGQTSESLDGGFGVHGTGCAEIVHEMAPGAELYFAHADSPVSFDDAVDWMIESDVDVVSFSAGKPYEPIDGTGPSAAKVQRAIDSGIFWVNSSGNFGLAHLDMNYTDKDGNGFHEFPNGDEILPFTVQGTSQLISLVWNDAWTGSQNNFDLLVLAEDDSGNLQTVASSSNVQQGSNGDNPFEQVRAEFPVGSSLFLAINAPSTVRSLRLNLTASGTEFQYSIPEGSLSAPADVEDVFTVGAVNWQDGVLENYSSQGPTWDDRTKPNIVAPARVTSASYGGEFAGTSASAPHVAGAAALVLQQNPGLGQPQLAEALTAAAIDQEPSGADNQSGSGNLNLGSGPEQFLIPDGGQAPPDEEPEAETEAGPSGSIDGVTVERKTKDGVDGFELVVDFQIQNLEGETTQLGSFFYFDSGRNIPLRDFNGRFSTQVGTVAVGTTFTPSSNQETKTGVKLFIPIDELHLSEGSTFNLKIATTLSSDAAGSRYIAISEWENFTVEF